MKEKDNKKEEIEKENLIGRITGISTDPLGSYTGRPLIRDELPVQDADDL